MSTQEQRAEWRRLEQAATPGEWVAHMHASDQFQYFDVETDEENEVEIVSAFPQATLWILADEEHERQKAENAVHAANVTFIAAARTAVPALLEDVARLEAENAQLRAELRRWLEVFVNCPPDAHIDARDYPKARVRLKALEERA